MKTCARCGKVKPLSEFVTDRKRLDGHGYWCKACHSQHLRAQRMQKKLEALV